MYTSNNLLVVINLTSQTMNEVNGLACCVVQKFKKTTENKVKQKATMKTLIHVFKK